MKILVIGATGMTGSTFVREALAQGDEITANSPSQEHLDDLKKYFKDIDTLAQDAFTLTREQLQQYDAVIDAFATAPEKAYLHVDLATHLVAQLRDSEKPRLVFVLGAGSLVTGKDKHLVVDDIAADPNNKPWLAIPENQLAELEFLRTVKNVNWLGISPSLDYHTGPASEKPVIGKDELITKDGKPALTSTSTLVLAILKELKKPQYHQERFTIANG
ncbi:NAD(P)-dependent oxidoreductase [Eupransor demetentiae]|uniref:NADH-flavin reductase (YwnB) n=1 Tax=Eupransor demetentiae TaxID=3109584 RepID=A0ABM9N5W3_9LACO|nr:Putative NADH-flavin reductase (YwnB) [Lactobacillaceae bacterium LMG 33000]